MMYLNRSLTGPQNYLRVLNAAMPESYEGRPVAALELIDIEITKVSARADTLTEVTVSLVYRDKDNVINRRTQPVRLRHHRVHTHSESAALVERGVVTDISTTGRRSKHYTVPLAVFKTWTSEALFRKWLVANFLVLSSEVICTPDPDRTAWTVSPVPDSLVYVNDFKITPV